MNVVGPAAATKLVKAEAESGASSRINLYEESPNYELSLDDFEVFALKRLKVLRKIEQLRLMRAPPDQTRQKIDQIIKEQGLSDSTIDQASHFILRLSYCQTEELRRWFLQYECSLFRHRLMGLSEQQLSQQVRQYAQLSPISKAEKKRLTPHLQALSLTPGEFLSSTFYAVPFQQALELVAKRKCYLESGFAYVPAAQVLAILVAKFRAQLSRRLALLSSTAGLAVVQDSEAARIYPLLKNLNRVLVNSDSASTNDQHAVSSALNAQNVGAHAQHMPLCMRQLHGGLLQDRKLKHWGRQQYGLFLKGAGLSLDDALAFFQRHFSAVTGEKFQKEYAYNIRHMYGQEGKRANYTAYACSKIILGNAPSSVGEHHGCPYKHYDADHLSALLQKLNVGTANDRRQIVRLSKQEAQYQLACLEHFKVMHPNAMNMGDAAVPLDGVGNHPNAWFRASVAYSEQQGGGGSNTVAVATSNDNAEAQAISP